MKESNIILRDLTLTLGIIALVLAVLFTLTSFQRVEEKLINTYNSTLEEKSADSGDEIQEDIVRYVVRQHTVVGGESFSLITGKYWDDIFLWPDLYILNDMQSEDPDLIFIDEIVDIYNRLGSKDQYSKREKTEILDAYIEVYERFKSLGEHKNNSAWTLLWCGTKYDKNFLDIYADRIRPEDLAVAQQYIAEEGYLD